MNEMPQAVWAESDELPAHDPSLCQNGIHLWAARFYQSGQLAFWHCMCCEATSQLPDPLTERLASLGSWVDTPPRLFRVAAQPPIPTRRWKTPEGHILAEGDPSSVDFEGLWIPGLTACHTYTESDAHGLVIATYAPSRERIGLYSDSYDLYRYLVVDDALIEYQTYCFEDSTYEMPNAKAPQTRRVMTGLSLITP